MECTSNRKIGKLRNLLRYAKIVSSNKALLNEEIRYPKHLVNNIIRQKLQNKSKSDKVNPDARETHKMQVMLSCGDTKGSKLMIKHKKQL